MVSAKNNRSGDASSRLTFVRGRLDAENVTLTLLIRDAYGVEAFSFVGAPSWINAARFDVHARADSDRQEMTAMLRTLLEDRFKLRTHREIREGAVYELRTTTSELKVRALQDGACTIQAQNASPFAPTTEQMPVCGAVRPSGNGIKRTLDVVGITTAALSNTLSLIVRRPVVDKTEINGRLGPVHLEYTPNDAGDLPGAEDTPGIFTALREQLGLQLVSAKGPSDVLVIEHIERPTSD